jgi:SAM-dependent methyltransferase
MSSIDPTFPASVTLAGLTIVRDFITPAVEHAITSLKLAPGARVLDVGTGGGGALPPLVGAIGATGSVLAVDEHQTILALASDYAEQAGIVDRVNFQLGDLTGRLADAATVPENAFDAIWASDVIYPVYFDEPVDIVRQMVQALRPGGVIALFYLNYYRTTYMPWHSLLERRLLTAVELEAGTPVDGPRHRERYLAWLLAAGLEDVNLSMFPRICSSVDADPTVRPYLEYGFPEVRRLAITHGVEAGLSAADVDEVQRLLTPGDPHYILDEPGYFVVLPATLVTGRRSREVF